MSAKQIWSDNQDFEMNRIYPVLFFVAVITILARPASAADDWTLHFAVSAAFGGAAETYLHHETEIQTAPRIFLSTVCGSLPGLAKEIADSTEEDNYFSGSDMTANVLGALTGSLLSTLLNDTISVRLNSSVEKKGVHLSLMYQF